MHKDDELQTKLNTEEPEQQFSLEDIMREFGGWTKEEPAEEPPAPEPEAEQPEETETPPVQTSFALSDLSGDTIRFTAIKEEDLQQPEKETAEPVEMPEEPVLDAYQMREKRKAQRRAAKRLRRLAFQRRCAQRAARRARRRDEPDIVYPSAEDACAAYAKGGTLRLRLLAALVMTMASMGLLVLSCYPMGILDLTPYARAFSVAALALLLAQCVLSMDVFVCGVYHALKLRFDLMSLLVLLVLLTVTDAFFAIPAGRTPFCPTASLALLVALRSVGLEKKAKWRTLKTVLSMEQPVAAVKVEKAWHDLDCIFRREGSLEDFTAMLETPDAAQKTMRVYAPCAAVVTLVLAVVSALQGASFLWAWTGLLTAALPAGGFLSCCRPFGIVAKRLSKAGAAICGWRGAKILSGEGGIIITDNDLFPDAHISMNGMKMYSEMPVRQVVGYATAVVQAAGSGLLPLFEKVMKDENARHYTVDSFRQYEGGGLGAEIRGDVVLLGSLAFMRLMGVHVPEGTRVQSAVYISVNRELAGVFALSYTTASGTKNGLQSVMHSAGLTPVLATRDFMITPGLVKKRYKIPTDRLEFPAVAERARLSAEDAGDSGRQGALMAKGGFAAFAAAVTGGRLLRRTVHSAVRVCLFSGLLGIGVLFLMTYLNAREAASAVNLLLYQLLWLVPGLLITGLVGKSE